MTIPIDEHLASFAFHPHEPWLVTGGKDGVKLIKLDNRVSEPQSLLADSTTKIAFNPNGDWLAAQTTDGNLYAWETLELNQDFDSIEIKVSEVNSFAFDLASSQSSSIIIAAVRERILNYLNLQHSSETRYDLEYLGHDAKITVLTYSHDNVWLATASLDGIIRIWEPPMFFPFDPLLRSLLKSDDSSALLSFQCGINSINYGSSCSGTSNCPFGTCQENLIQIGVESLLQLACGRAGRNLTQAEWTEYFLNEPYRLVCPQWPAGK
ncbi:MAG: WD40 repeat domain-containing protein [Caldilineaceae bacterium]